MPPRLTSDAVTAIESSLTRMYSLQQVAPTAEMAMRYSSFGHWISRTWLAFMDESQQYGNYHELAALAVEIWYRLMPLHSFGYSDFHHQWCLW